MSYDPAIVTAIGTVALEWLPEAQTDAYMRRAVEDLRALAADAKRGRDTAYILRRVAAIQASVEAYREAS